MKEFKDFKIEDFKERIKMPKQNLEGKRIIVTSFAISHPDGNSKITFRKVDFDTKITFPKV